jgi:hypothetical protein
MISLFYILIKTIQGIKFYYSKEVYLKSGLVYAN